MPTSPRDLDLTTTPLARAVALNEAWHSRLPLYETGFALNAKVCFAAKYKNVIYAVAIWNHPLARNLPQQEWLELRRMAIAPDAPKYTGSWMLAGMKRWLQENARGVTRLISYHDTAAHKGTIYKAAGWVESGRRSDHAGWSRPRRRRADLQLAFAEKVRWEIEIG